MSRTSHLASPGRPARAVRPRIPLNTNGRSLSYIHTDMYGMYALQESVRQIRHRPAQIPGANILVCRVGGVFAASGTIIISNEVH